MRRDSLELPKKFGEIITAVHIVLARKKRIMDAKSLRHNCSGSLLVVDSELDSEHQKFQRHDENATAICVSLCETLKNKHREVSRIHSSLRRSGLESRHFDIPSLSDNWSYRKGLFDELKKEQHLSWCNLVSRTHGGTTQRNASDTGVLYMIFWQRDKHYVVCDRDSLAHRSP